MEPQTVVKKIKTGEVGVVVSDHFGVCTSNETLVVFDGDTFAIGTSTDKLEVVGPEKAVADFKRCGGGKGKECCMFLAADAGGFCCERFGSLRYSIIFKDGMTAQRHPARLYPECQLEREK